MRVSPPFQPAPVHQRHHQVITVGRSIIAAIVVPQAPLNNGDGHTRHCRHMNVAIPVRVRYTATAYHKSRGKPGPSPNVRRCTLFNKPSRQNAECRHHAIPARPRQTTVFPATPPTPSASVATPRCSLFARRPTCSMVGMNGTVHSLITTAESFTNGAGTSICLQTPHE